MLCITILIGCTEKKGDNKQPTSSLFLECSELQIPAGMKCIPGGTFIRGSNRVSDQEDKFGDRPHRVKDEYPKGKVTVSTFFMDTYEVTYSDYQKCIKAKGCTYARTNYGRPYSKPKQPMLGANWYQARDYCKWLGKRLPTEAEWEKAARGDKGDLYPWGNEKADCSKAIILDPNVKGKNKKGCGTGVTWDVGSKPSYRYGLYDMAGNSWEWVNDWYSASYQKCGVKCTGKDPQGPCGGKDKCPGHKFKIVRGGSWWWKAEYALASNRRPHYPSNKPYHHFGFRCAKSP